MTPLIDSDRADAEDWQLAKAFDALKVRAEAAEARLRAAKRYADGLHFAGRLHDEQVVRAALASYEAEPADPAELGGEG